MNVNLFRIKKRLCYALIARHKRGYGIHSPFLYELITEVFRNKKGEFVVITNEKLLDCQCKQHSLNAKQRVLYNVARWFGGKAVMVCGNREENRDVRYFVSGAVASGAKVVNEQWWQQHTQHSGTTNREDEPFAANNFGAIFLNLPSVAAENRPLLEQYFEKIKGCVCSETVVIINNIDHSKAQFQTWKGLTEKSGVTLAIDLCSFGMIFFKRGLSKEYRVIKI